MKYNYLFFFLIFLSSCSWLQSDYDKLINPIKEIKLAEKKAGKPNPTFDGVVEPDLPDEKLNNETLEGIDSNKDGVRDDVEIWINRVAEDEYVRLSLKHLYIKNFAVHLSVWKDEPMEIQNKKSWESTASLFCLSKVLTPYRESYISKGIIKDEYYLDQISVLAFNNIDRKKLVGKMNKYEGIEGEHGEIDLMYCNSQINVNYLRKFDLKQ